MRTLLVLRGIDKTRNIEAWEEGVLEAVPGGLKLQGVAQKWRSKVEHGEKWNLDEGKKEEEEPRKDGGEKPCVHKGAVVALGVEREMVPWDGVARSRSMNLQS